MDDAPNRTETIAGRLRDDILRGRYQPGERLPAERELATHLGVNRGSVREALKQLEQLGLVAIRRGDGTTVRHLQDASVEVLRHLIIVDGRIERGVLRQVLDVFDMLVAGTASLGVERGDDETLARARALLQRARAEGMPSRPGLMGEFAEIMFDASGNLAVRLFRNAFVPTLVEVLEMLRPFWQVAPLELTSEVEQLDDALRDRDPDAADRAVRRIVRKRGEWIFKMLDAHEASANDGEDATPGSAP